MDSYTLVTFFLIISLMVISPGPNGVLIFKTVSVVGKRHGYMNVLGIVTAFFLHGTLSIFGLSAIIASSANLFFIIKMLGALYLTYLGVKTIVSVFNTPEETSKLSQNKLAVISKRLSTSFWEGLLTNLLNPKVSMFYLAAFPQFVNFEMNAIESSYILVTIHALFAAIWFSLMVCIIGKSILLIKSHKAHLLLQSISGSVLLWFGYRLTKE